MSYWCKNKRISLSIFIVCILTIHLSASGAIGKKHNKSKATAALNDKSAAAHCILQKETERIVVADDGTYLDEDEVFITILDQKGKREQQVQTFFINKNYSNLEILGMEVIHKDATRTTIDWKANSKETNPAQTTRMNIYDPNQKVIKVFIPGLKIGDTIHYKIRVHNFKPMIQGHFFANAILQYNFPAKAIDLQIVLPRQKVLYSLIKDRDQDAKITSWQKTTGKTRIYHWKFRNIPELTPEPRMPEPDRVAMRLLLSTMKSWKDVSKWYCNLAEPHLKPTPAIIKKVQELVKGKNKPDEKIRALFFFVSRKIRYMGLIEEAKRPGFEPHDVALTFERRYGVCRDKAALLVSMLRVAGFRAVPVLIKAGGKLDPEIPIPQFNHAICAVIDEHDLPVVYLDPTSETSNQFLPDYEQDSSCLPATPTGSDLLLTPVNPPSKNMFVMDIDDWIDAEGNMKGTISFTASNFIDTAFRSILMPKTKDHQKRFLEVFLLKRRPGITVEELNWTDPADTSKPFSVSCNFKLEKAVKRKRLYPISLARDLGLMDSWLLAAGSMTKRRYPLKLRYAIKSVIREKIHFPDSNIKVINFMLPKLQNITTKHLHLKNNITASQNEIKIERVFVNSALELPPKEYKGLLDIQAELLRDEFLPILIGKETY